MAKSVGFSRVGWRSFGQLSGFSFKFLLKSLATRFAFYHSGVYRANIEKADINSIEEILRL